MVNGKPSWTSISTSIWHDHATNWLIGSSENIGTNLPAILSVFGTNHCPFRLQSVFWDFDPTGLGWQALPENVLNIDCLKN